MTPPPTLAIAATFTAEPLEAALSYWKRELKWPHEIRFAGFGQVFQTLLDPSGLFAANSQGGVNVVLIRPGDVTNGEGQLIEAVTSYSARVSAPLIVMVCPPAGTVQETLVQKLSGLPGVYLVGPAQVEALYPVAEVYDPQGEKLGGIPYSPLYYTALATMIARTVDAILRPPYKVIVLDCDNTLWQGTAGEDGPENVVIDQSRRVLQEFMVAQQQSGALLCLCSKNNEEDVRETFRVHPEMPLRWEHLVAWRINWESKGPNLASLAAELNVGLDSFLFLDDDAKECGEVQASVPAVLTLPLPHQEEEIPHFLRHVWAFDRLRATAEDRQRTASYQQSLERNRVARQATSLADFLRELRLEVRIAPATPAQVARVAQLTQRTNQMNTTTVRHSEGAIRGMLEARDRVCLAVEVCDRFGDYGLVGVMLGRELPGVLLVENFLLSCRALGRGVEHRMLAHLGRVALQRELGEVWLPFEATAKNQPAAALLVSLEGIRRGGEAEGQFRFAAQNLAELTYQPGEPVAAPVVDAPAAAASRTFSDYGRIVRELSHITDIQEQVHAYQRRERSTSAAVIPARTPLEAQLAGLWAELLHLPAVGPDEDFFDLGGHSLLAVQMLSRVRQMVGVEVPLDVVYGGTLTVSELARGIELQELAQVDSAEYAALLEELEGLSDEEVRQLLAEEGQ